MNARYVFAALLLMPPIAGACTSELAGGTQLESARFSLSFRTQPGKIGVGRHFAVEFAVCPKDSAHALESLRVDAHMPDHRHGMNYAAQLTAAAGGRYRAEGLLFHMPGRWEFVFDLRSGDRTDRLTQSVLLE